MPYWWVNQKQTWRHELAGGYLWSPKRNANGARNQFYENMKAVRPGDVVFSYWETAIRAWGLVSSFGYDAPKPVEFGDAGRNWSQIGNRVDVQYTRTARALEPRAHGARLQPLLPEKYSPLNRETLIGLQSVYLAGLPETLGAVLVQLLQAQGEAVAAPANARELLVKSFEEPERKNWEHHIEAELRTAIPDSTEREALIKARKGQGLFRTNVAHVEDHCRVTRVSNPAYLIASHIKPWRHADNAERVSGNNGLLLAPHVDFLFDRGFISFGEGKLLISDVADEKTLVKIGIDPERKLEVGGFTQTQERFLEFHRANIFRSAKAA